MKKIFVLNGSRQKEGNTTKFVRKIIEKLDKNIFETEFAYPQDYEIRFCVGCHQCFINAKCSIKDEIELLQEKILSADIFIVASPVYLHYITLKIKPNEKVAIVGASGSGKSTLLKLAASLYQTTKGEVFYDSYNVKELDIQKIRENIGIVLQENVLFNGTFRENITMGRTFLTEKIYIETTKKLSKINGLRHLANA